MRQFRTAVAFLPALLIPALSPQASNPFAGRWDITIKTPDSQYPGWMEVVEETGAVQVRVQPRTGNVRPAAAARIEGSNLHVTVSRASATAGELTWELSASGGKLAGHQKSGGTVSGQILAVRAPALKSAAPRAWSEPETLFNGKDLAGWEPVNNTPATLNPTPLKSYWVAKDGELVNEAKGSNLKTTRRFDDFKLHIEFNCPAGENSGIYLRGRYEVQVSPGGGGPRTGRGNPTGGLGSIYGYLTPAVEVPARPGEWQSYDITLIGRYVTVVLNGVTIHDNQEIAGITGGALDSNEGEPGPFYLQGDHHGGVRYRNITVSVPKR